MPKTLIRIVCFSLVPCLIFGELNAACLTIPEVHPRFWTVPEEVLTNQPLSAPANVFRHPSSITTHAGVVLAVLAAGTLAVYGSIEHPKAAFSFLSALAVIFS